MKPRGVAFLLLFLIVTGQSFEDEEDTVSDVPSSETTTATPLPTNVTTLTATSAETLSDATFMTSVINASTSIESTTATAITEDQTGTSFEKIPSRGWQHKRPHRHDSLRSLKRDRQGGFFEENHWNTQNVVQSHKKSRKRPKQGDSSPHKTFPFNDETLLNDGIPSDSTRKASQSTRPNIILIMTDDQDVELGSLQFMPKLNRYLRQEGATFDFGYVSTPMCCPSRSSMLTGLYVHNHNVLTNNDNCSSPMWIEKHEPRTFGKYLSDAGYKTGYFGKYLNKYNGNRIPVGWDEWTALIRNSRFYNYTLNVNGQKVKHGFDYKKDYFPDLITNDSLAFFRNSKLREPSQPVLMVMSYPGPHGPEDSAPQFSNLFFNVTTHHTPAYDYAPNPDKQWVLQVTDRMEPIHKKFTDLLMTKRLQTLQSIDDGVERLYHQLHALGELENTYIFYTSDHGYHLGQFGLVKGKSFPFEVDTKVPFIVRGPGVTWKNTPQDPVVNIDLAPTFLDLAGVPIPSHMDGRSIVPLLKDDKLSLNQENNSWRHAFLIERGKMTTQRYQKIQHRDEILKLNGSALAMPALTNRYLFQDEDDALEDDDDRHVMVGEDVNADDDSVLLFKDQLTNQERLAVECLKPRLQAPCQLYQRHKCIRKKNGLWKIKSCNNFKFLSQDLSSSMPNDFRNCDCSEKDFGGFRDYDFQQQKKYLGNQSPRTQHKLSRNSPREEAEHFRRHGRETMDDQQTPKSEVQSVLTEMAEQEIDEVDFIMDDINDELKDLQEKITNENSTSANSSFGHSNELSCHIMRERKVNCSSEVYNNRDAWRSSRSYINNQIKRLRVQLSELKEIRKHLKKKRPILGLEDSVESANIDFKAFNDKHAKLTKKKCNCKKIAQLNRRQERRKQRQKMRIAKIKHHRENKLRKEKKKQRKDSCSVDSEKLNCFSHNNDHWKTPPLWTDGSFCACTNSNTNTYSCVRNINGTHNYLYCEFVSGTITYYDLKIDPHQLRNIYQTLSFSELNFMHKQLLHLKKYKGQNDLDPAARKFMIEYGNPPQLEKKVGVELEQGTKSPLNRNSLQRKLIKKYGQFLPPPHEYRQRLWSVN